MVKTKLSEQDEEEICKLLQKESRFIWSKRLNCNYTIMMLNNILSGEISLSEFLPGGAITYKDYIFERGLLKFVE